MTTDMFRLPLSQSGPFSFMPDNMVCNKSNTKGGTCGAGTAYPSVAPEFAHAFTWLSGIRVVAIVKVHVLTCLVPCCNAHFDIPIKRYSIRPDFRWVLCFVNVI